MTPDNAAVAEGALIGHHIDERYALEAVIGVGGLGSVYRATHTKLQRSVAVKLLHETFGESQVQRGRFAREAKALAALQHPNIVAVLDYGVAQAQPYLVMELLEGETLSQRLHRGPLGVEAALRITQQLLEALSFMHRARLVHRDVKPSNVFLQRMRDGTDRVKVLDFGLAKFTATPMMVNSDPTLTRDGAILGTPAYMSPEQATGEIVDASSDVYAVGVILFRMLAGRLPFEGDAIEQVRSHLIAPVPALDRAEPEPELDREIEALIRLAMSKRREDRYADAGQMLRALVGGFPQYVHATLPEHEPVLPDPFAVDALNADWLLSNTDASSDVPTLPRDKRPSPVETTRGSVQIVGSVMRTLVITSVRVFAGVSVLLVIGAGAIFVLLLRTEQDRAELSALQRRVSDRLIERSSVRPTSGAEPRDHAGYLQPSAAMPAGTADSASPARPASAGAVALASGTSAGLAVGPSDQGLPPGATAVISGTGISPSVPAPALPPPLPPGQAAFAAAQPPAPDEIPSPTLDRMPPPSAAETSVSAIERAPPEPTVEALISTRLAAALERAANAGSAALELPPPADLAPEISGAYPAPATVPAADPWRLAIPPKLRAARKVALANGRGSENMVLALREYNRDQREDPRGHLLLGQLYLNRFWRADALTQFSIAIALDPSARGAPEVLTGLIALFVHGGVGPEAGRLIANRFGPEAVPAIDEALATAKDPKVVARLRALRARALAER